MTEEALELGDYKGALELLRIAQMNLGIMKGYSRMAERDLKASTRENKLRQLYARLSNGAL